MRQGRDATKCCEHYTGFSLCAECSFYCSEKFYFAGAHVCSSQAHLLLKACQWRGFKLSKLVNITRTASSVYQGVGNLLLVLAREKKQLLIFGIKKKTQS